MRNHIGHIGVVLLVGFFVLAHGQIDSSAPWPTLRGDQARTGQSTLGVTVTSTTPQVQWHRTFGGGAGQWSISGAILEDGSIIVSGTGEYPRTYEIFSFDTTGRQQWTYSYKTIYYNPGISGSPIVGTGDQIFWNVPAEALMSFDAKGNLLWKKVSIYNLASGDSVLNDDLLYGFNFAFDPSEEALRGFNETDGVVSVNTTLIGTSSTHISLSNAGHVYLGACDVIRSATLDGELLFETTVEFGCFSHLSVNNTNEHSFGVANFYKSDFGRRVYGFDSKGSVLWNYTLTHHPPDGSYGDGVAIYQGLVFAGSDGVLVALDQTSGGVVWEQTFTSTTPVTVTAPVIDVNGQLFVVVANEVTQHAAIWGFDALTGDKLYQSDDISCTVYGIGAVLAIGPSNSFVLICRSSVFYFA